MHATQSCVARRGMLFVTLVIAVVLAGCGAATSDEEASTDRSTSTRTVQDYFGDVEVPAEPQRIVAADPVSLSLMLSVGVEPVAASFNPLAVPAYFEDHDDIVNVAGEGGFSPNIEAIVAQDPDLVVVVAGYDDEGSDAWNKDTYDQIAATGIPTYGFAFNDGVSMDDIDHGVTSVADALGVAEQGQSVMSTLTDRMGALRQRVADAGLAESPVTAVRLSDNGAYSIRVGTSESVAFRELGMARPDGQDDPSQFRIDVAPENLTLLASADILFVYTDDGAEAERAAISALPLWSTLPAVRTDSVHWVDAGVWNSADPIGMGRILDDIESMILEPAEQA